MARVWDPVAKKWVDKPAGTAGTVPAAYAGLPMSMAPEEAQGYSDYGSDYGTSGSLEEFFGGGTAGTGSAAKPTARQSRRRGMRAAGVLERAGRQAQAGYASRAEQQAAAMRGMYNPMFAQQEAAIKGLRGQAMSAYDPYFTEQQTGIEAQRKAAIDFLEKQYGGSQTAIEQATQAALAGIPVAQAYSNVPLVELQAQANPLMGEIAGFGAETGGVQAQSVQDTILAQQMAQLARGSAGQLQSAQEAMRNAALQDARFGGSQALQQLALQRLAQMGGIESARQQGLSSLAGERARLGADFAAQEATGLADLAKQRAGADVEVEQARQALLNEGLAALLGGQQDAATQRAKTIAEFGGRVRRKGGKSKSGKK